MRHLATPEREIAVDGLRNLRDAGGLPTLDGGTIRRGVLLRSEAPVGLSETGLAALGELRLRTTMDLRSRGHIEFAETHLPDAVRVTNLVIHPPADGAGNGLIEQVLSGNRRDYSADELLALYVAMLDEQAPAFGIAVAHLADPDNLPCLVHCHAGKDRTGLVVAMALELAGVGREDILHDFEATTWYRRHRREEVAADLARTGTEWERVAPLFTAPREVLDRSLNHIGSARRYLTDRGGVNGAALDRVAENLRA